jgi:hypothetical protein
MIATIVARRHADEKAKRLGLRIDTDSDVLWLRPYHRNPVAEEQHERAGEYRLLAALAEI